MRWYQRFFRRKLTEQHLDAELGFHPEQQIADYIAAGTEPEEARRRARLEFRGLDQVKEDVTFLPVDGYGYLRTPE